MTNIIILVVGTLATGAANSLFTKYQDNQCVRNCNNPDATTHLNFEQPALQTLQMFIGELSVIVVFTFIYRWGWFQSKNEYIPIANGETDEVLEKQSYSIWENVKLSIPALCDMIGTTLLNIGLIYTPVSIYQMTRGSVVLFVAILSVVFLKRRVTKLEWISLFFVTAGVSIVGLSGSKNAGAEDSTEESAALVLFGIFLIVLAEILQASQFVVEEHILKEKDLVPLKLVYCEGFYGFTILLGALIVLNSIIGSVQTPGQFLDSPFNLHESLRQMFYAKEIYLSSFCIMVSIALFNFFGVSLTHQLSATARSTVDTCRTLIVWIFAISMGWEQFHFLQFGGFVVLVFGTLCFNKVLHPEEWKWVPAALK